MPPMILQCHGLQWGVAGRALTPPLDLQLSEPGVMAIVGTNGCGKSSLLKVIAGLQKPLAGRVQLSGGRVGGLGYLVQQPQLDRQFPIDVRALVSAGFWGMKLSARERDMRLQRALSDWQLDALAERSLLALSGGELQRALLARMGLTSAKLLLLDEPEASLDETGQQLLWQRVNDWREEGRSVLIVSHDLPTIRQQAQTCLHIDPQGCRYTPGDWLAPLASAEVA
ncbi:MAG: ATP-binding cassette domain-containing protein [Pseudomonas sp.]|uniref:metal ABC transporter ATP-binding protein n=1 Tax=Pseudomonas sp. TaxID=306 RepID=UPI0039820840